MGALRYDSSGRERPTPRCGSACTSSAAAWTTLTLADDLLGETQLTLDAAGLPAIAGYASGGTVDFERCTQAPCTVATQWVEAPLVVDGMGGWDRLGFQLTSSGDGRLAYTNTQGNLRLVGEDGGLWSNNAVTACGSTLVTGAQPALFLTASDDARLAFTSSMLAGDAGPTAGAGYLANGP